MKTHAKVVVIGGGVVGCSALYHLAERGWTDTVLVEMDELTSGSTWHAAGNIPTFSGTRNMIKLQHYSTQLYDKLSKDPDYPINYHQTGSIRLAQDQARMEEFHHVSAMANAMGIEYEMIDLAEMKKRNPFLEDHELQGALWDPYDGDIDPSQLTQALASKARKMGAEINRFTKVTGLERVGSEWKVKTDKGDIQCEYIINAGGYRGAEIGEFAGKYLPLVSMEHQYLVTESIPELEGHDGLIPLVRDPDDSYYLRQEKTGLILGPYEWQATPHWADGKIPDNFAYELYPDDLDRLEWYIEQACARMPILGTVGVQRVINGPIPYSPDGNPYVGPAFGLPNFFHCCGFSFGICQGGGAGKSIAEWLIDGQPEWDLWSLDPRRYTEYANQKYVVDRATELYQNEYAIHFPEDEWPAGRPALTTATYERVKAKGAQMGARGGWERATWFPQNGDSADMPEKGSFHHKPWFSAVAAECKHVREKVGLLDLGGFSKYELSGEGAAKWLDSLIAGNLPKVGRLTLSYFCTPTGGLWCEMTITRLDEDHFILVTAAAAKWHDYQWLVDHMPAEHALDLRDITDKYGTLVVAGPQSRDVMQKLSNNDFSNSAFPWLTCQRLVLEGADVIALRVNYVGELGWELHVPVEKQVALYDALMNVGKEYGIRDFGMYAMESMRLEKCYRAWKAELDHEYSPLRSGLSRFVNLDKPDFIGKQALVDELANGLPDLFVPFVLDDDTCDAVYGCPVLQNGEVVGYTTSGGYGHYVQKSIALGYIRTDLAKPGTKVQINVLGKMREAEVVAEPIYDPANEKLRS